MVMLPKRPLRLLTLVAFGLIVVLFLWSNIRPSQSSSTKSGRRYGFDVKKLRDEEGWVESDLLAEGVANVIDARREPTQKKFDLPQVIHRTSTQEVSDPATMSWYYANPGEIHYHYNDHKQRAYVLKRFPFRVVEVYKQLRDATARAHLFRYLVMQRDGGVYADDDTTCLMPITNWIPSGIPSKEVGIVVGIAIDEKDVKDDKKLRDWGYVQNFQFAHWTFMSRPDHPVWAQAVEYMIDGLLRRVSDEGKKDISDLDFTSREDLMKVTGGVPFTHAVLNHLGIYSNEALDASGLRGLKQPTLFHDVLVLPTSAFAPNQEHSGSLGVETWENLQKILVMHDPRAPADSTDDRYASTTSGAAGANKGEEGGRSYEGGATTSGGDTTSSRPPTKAAAGLAQAAKSILKNTSKSFSDVATRAKENAQKLMQEMRAGAPSSTNPKQQSQDPPPDDDMERRGYQHVPRI
ncbi:alpha-1,6-mannosyltransferase Och1 [Savitreella phatthalungensis]